MMRTCGCRAHNGFLTAKGLAETAQQINLSIGDGELQDGVDMGEPVCYLDRSGSVSALSRVESHWDDDVIDEQYRRFLNEVGVYAVNSKVRVP